MLNKFEVAGLMSIANIPWSAIHAIPNEYWGHVEAYKEIAEKNPWYLIMTPKGNIKIGPRKRVINIDWFDTDIKKTLSTDDVTKGDFYIHAWDLNKASEYLNELGKEF